VTGQQTAKPPPVLASARVLAYAILDGSVGFSGRSRVFVESRELGRVPRLVIAEGLEAADVVLLYCDDDWNVLAASATSAWQTSLAGWRRSGSAGDCGRYWAR
jgi:hypothetical protein